MFGIGSVIGKIFGTEKALTAVVDNVSSGLDKCFYTDEEKAEDGRKERSEARALIIEWQRTSQGQNLARRVIAFAITGTWLFQYWLVMIFNLSGIVWIEKANELTKASVIVKEQADSMTGAVMLIMTFYFAAPHIGKGVDAMIAKFNKGKDV